MDVVLLELVGKAIDDDDDDDDDYVVFDEDDDSCGTMIISSVYGRSDTGVRERCVV